jgi:hypothetical protein
MSLSVIFSNTYSANASILGDSGVLSNSFTGNNMYVREATMHIERNSTPTSVAYVLQILDSSNNVLATSRPYSIQNLIDEFGSAQRGEPRFVFDGTFKVNSGTTYKLAITRFSGSGSNIYVHQSTTVSTYYCIIWGSTIESGGYTPDWNNVPFIQLKGNMTLNASSPTTDPKQFIEIRSNPHVFTQFETDIVPFMRQYDSTWDYDNPKSTAIKFKSNTSIAGHPLIASLFQVNFNITGGTGPNPGIVCSHHFVIRKDLLLNGMIDCIEGAIVLHAGPYRQWLGSYQNPTIYTKEDNHHMVDFKKFWPDEFVPIRVAGVYTEWLETLPGKSGIRLKSTLLDGNGNSGVSGQVLTSQGGSSAPIWQTPGGGGASNVKSGQVTTDANGNATINFSSPAFGSEPSITCTVKDTNGRPITVIITAASASSFTIKTMVHKHFIGTVSAKETNPLTNHTHPINALQETMTVTTTVSSHNHQFARSHFGNAAGNSGATQAATSNVPSHVRPLYLRDGLGNTVYVGGSMMQANSGDYTTENLVYTGPMSSNSNQGTIQEQIGNITVNWIATPKTQ